MAKKKGKEKPKIDFKKISAGIADMDKKQYIDQLSPALTDVFIKHAKYTDKKGVVQYKTEFDRKDGEKLADALFDALTYHSHRRVFGMNEDQMKDLANYKDKNGNPYIDIVTQYHFQIDRKGMRKKLASKDKGNEITPTEVVKQLSPHIEKHKELLLSEIISKEGLDEPKHGEAVKKAINSIVSEYNFNKETYDTSKMYNHNELLQAFVQLSNLTQGELYKKKKAA